MTAISAPLAVRSAWPVVALTGGATFLGLVVVRALGLHDGLLYPDGYQYLLMARGIAEHLEPVTTLGAGGDVFTPNADAAAKPFFPALVALLDTLGLEPLAAARAVAVVTSAAVPVLTGLLALRLGAGRLAAAAAVVLCAASPTLGYWSGYAGPDALAQALALLAALALLHRHPVAGGALVGLCVLTRVEYAIVAAAVLLVGVGASRLRRDALLAALSGVLVVGVLVGLVRPPVEVPALPAMLGGLALALLAAGLLVVSGRVGTVGAAGVALAVSAPLVVLDGGAWASLAGQDWALLSLSAAGLALSLRVPGHRSNALRIVALSLPLAVTYWVKNPGLERYVAQLVPELALVAALGLATLHRARLQAAATAAALAAGAAVMSSQPTIGVDAFQELAPALDRAPAGTLVTAAPDAYGFLLAGRPVRAMRSGAEGLVLMDGAARAYAPGLRVAGTAVRRITVITGFQRPDGVVDREPAILYRGRVGD